MISRSSSDSSIASLGTGMSARGYEASGAGYVLHRAIEEWGYTCDLIAPSLIPKRPGVQRSPCARHVSPHVCGL